MTTRTGDAVSRLAAVGGLIGAALVLGFLVWPVLHTNSEPAQQPATPAPAKPPRPKLVLHIVFPEGFTRKDMAQRIAAVDRIAKRKRHVKPHLSPRQYLRLTASSKLPATFAGDSERRPLEGFLFPATYEFTRATTTKQLVRMQLAAFRRAWKQVDLDYAKSKNLTAYDVLIIASMIEKEVQVPKERRLVSAVIYNRLGVGLPLGIDATLRYGLNIPATEPIHESQRNSDSPYNTRKFAGLPPTPIANPGLASIKAAAHPAPVNYLYFVRKSDCKSHFFTASAQAFFSYPRSGLNC